MYTNVFVANASASPSRPPYHASVDFVLVNTGASPLDLSTITLNYFLGQQPGKRYDAFVWSAGAEGGHHLRPEDVSVSFAECADPAESWSSSPGSRVRMAATFATGLAGLAPGSRAVVRTRVAKRIWPREPLDGTAPWSELRLERGAAPFSLPDPNGRGLVSFALNPRAAVLDAASGALLSGDLPPGYAGEGSCSEVSPAPPTTKPGLDNNYAREASEPERAVRRMLQQWQRPQSSQSLGRLLQPLSLSGERELTIAPGPSSGASPALVPCASAGPWLRVDSRFDESLPQLQYVKLLIENTGDKPVSLDGLRVPFPYRELGERHDLVAACTNPVTLGATMTNEQRGGYDVCSHITVEVGETEFVATFKNYTLCPRCKLDGFSDALSLFGVYDEHWQMLNLDVTMGSSSCGGGQEGAPALGLDPLRQRPDTAATKWSTMGPGSCHAVKNANYGGTVLSKPGLTAESAAECCDLCHGVPGCNVWTFCGEGCQGKDENACVLKFEEALEPQVLSRGKYTPWASGYLGLTQDQPQQQQSAPTYSAAMEHCTAEVSNLAATCTTDYKGDASTVSQWCCDSIAKVSSGCLCRKDFGAEVGAMQDALRLAATEKCGLSLCDAIGSGSNQEVTWTPKSLGGGAGSPSAEACDLGSLRADLAMEANEDYTELFLVGNVANTPTAAGGRVGDFTVPIFFSRGVRGPRGQWYRAGPEEFVLECADPVVVSTSFGPVQRRRLSCDDVSVRMEEEGILFSLRGDALCAGCSVQGTREMPVWRLRHVSGLPLDYIHINPVLASNGPIVGKPFCDIFPAPLGETVALEAAQPLDLSSEAFGDPAGPGISKDVWRDPSETNTAQDILYGNPGQALRPGRFGAQPPAPGIQEASALHFGPHSVTPEQLRLLAPGQAAMLLQELYTAQAAQALGGMDPRDAVPILQAMSPAEAAKIMNAMPGSQIAGILRQMQPTAASQLVGSMSPVAAASGLQFLQPREEQAILSLVDPQQATRVQNAMPPASVSPDRLGMMTPQQAARTLGQLYPTQAAAALRGLSPVQAATILEAMPPADAAQIMDVMPGGAVADLLSVMQPAAAQELVGNMSPVVKADALRQMSPQVAQALMTPASDATASAWQPQGVQNADRLGMGMRPTSDQLALMNPGEAAQLLQGMYTTQAAQALGGMDPRDAVPILQAMSPAEAAKIMNAMPGSQIAGILRQMQPTAASQLVGSMSPVAAASGLQFLQPREEQAILSLVDPQQATRVQNAMPPASVSPDRLGMMTPQQAARTLGQLYPTQAAAALRGLSPVQAATILEAMPPADAAQIMDVMPGGAVADLLSVMQPAAAQELVGNMSPVVKADALRQMSPQVAQALMTPASDATASAWQPQGVQNADRLGMGMRPTSDQLALMNPGEAAQLLQGMTPSEAARILNGLEPWQVMPILRAMPLSTAVKVVEVFPGTQIAGLLRHMPPHEAATMLNEMNAVIGASGLQPLQPREAENIMNLMNPQQATRVQNAMTPASVGPDRLARLSPQQAAGVLTPLYPTQAAAALRGLSPAQASLILDEMNGDDAAAILNTLPAAVVAELLSQMDRTKALPILDRMSPVLRAEALNLMDASGSYPSLSQADQLAMVQNDLQPENPSGTNIDNVYNVLRPQHSQDLDLSGLSEQERALLLELLGKVGGKNEQGQTTGSEERGASAASALPIALDLISSQGDRAEEGVVILEFSKWVKVGDLWDQAEASEFEIASSNANNIGEVVLAERDDSIQATLPATMQAFTITHKLGAAMDPREPTVTSGSQEYTATMLDNGKAWLLATEEGARAAAVGGSGTDSTSGGGDTVRLVSEVSPLQAARVLDTVDDELATEILSEMPIEDIARVLGLLPADRAARLVGLLPEARRAQLLPLLQGKDGDAIALEALAPFLPCPAQELRQTLRAKVMDAGTKYGIVGKVENPTNATVSLDGLSLRVALSPWAKDALGVWERRQEGLQYRVDCAWIGGSGGVGNLCQNAKVSVENNTATVTLSGGTLCSGCELSGPPDGVLISIHRNGQELDPKSPPLVALACPGDEMGDEADAMAAADEVGVQGRVTVEASPWFRPEGSVAWQRGTPDEFEVECRAEGDACSSLLATIRTTQNQEAIEVSFNAAGPLEISISSKTGGELDYREPIVTSDGFGSQVELSEDGKEWKITLLAE